MVSIYMYTIYNQGYSPTSATFIYAPIQQLKQNKNKTKKTPTVNTNDKAAI